jgi:glycerol-3-phosphate dehydrogenase
VGPTAFDFEDKEGVNTTAAGLAEVSQKASLTVKNLPLRSVITSFAGLRAHGDQKDFVLGEVSDCEGFFDCACIESPGLSAAPAIGVYLAGLIKEKLHLEEKEDFQPKRIGILHPLELPPGEREAFIRQNPAYGTIICRCEKVTEGEIIDAVTRPLGARSLDGVKRRTRAGMGRCQAGFCSPRVLEILSRETGIPLTELTKSGGNSKVVTGGAKDAEL